MTGLESGFYIADAEVRPLEGLVVGPVGRVRIEPKSMAVLVELAQHAGSVCSREQIQQRVWPRGFTTDDVLTRCIGQIRKALDDDPKNPTHVETLPRRGYRLLHPVRAAAKASATDTRAPEKLIVLPFQYLASDNADYLADGMTELLTARLATLREIRVLSRTTAMHYKERALPLGDIAQQTGADWAVEGSVLQSGDRVQVVVQLIDARTDAHVWADDYLRDIGDMLLLQNDIVRKIATAVRLRFGDGPDLADAPATLPAEAMREYLLGRHLLSKRTPEALRESIEQFASVCNAVPDFAPAWASRAEARFMLCHYGAEQSADALELCNADLHRALTLDPDLAIALVCRAGIRFMADGDFDAAEIDLKRALEILPGYSLAMLLLANLFAVQARFDEATRWLDQALLVDPLDTGINMNLGDHLILQRRYDDAVASLRKTLEIVPAHRPSQLRLAWALALAKKIDAANEMLAETGPGGDRDWQWHEYAALCAGTVADSGNARSHFEAMQTIKEESFVSPWSMARAAAAADMPDACLHWLGVAKEERSTSFPFVGVTPAFDALRDHADFLRMVDRSGTNSHE